MTAEEKYHPLFFTKKVIQNGDEKVVELIPFKPQIDLSMRKNWIHFLLLRLLYLFVFWLLLFIRNHPYIINDRTLFSSLLCILWGYPRSDGSDYHCSCENEEYLSGSVFIIGKAALESYSIIVTIVGTLLSLGFVYDEYLTTLVAFFMVRYM